MAKYLSYIVVINHTSLSLDIFNLISFGLLIIEFLLFIFMIILSRKGTKSIQLIIVYLITFLII